MDAQQLICAQRRTVRLDGLGDGANLVDLEQQAVARLLLDGGLNSQRVCDGQVITDNLDTALLRDVSPRLPVVLVEGVLDRHDRILLDVAEVEVRKLDAGNPFRWVRVRVLEVKVVLALLVELRRSDIECDLDLALIASLLDSLGEELEGFLSTRDVGCETTLVTNVCRWSYSPCKLWEL